jgi:pimeloyl-ACP methyl ester carboxylesterase
MTDLVWEQQGEGDRAFVWAHGLTSSRRGDDDSGRFEFSRAAMASGSRYIRYDARGHGRSPAPHDEVAYHWDCLASDMFAVADAAGAASFCAAGASMGAATALYAALAIPERVAGLVLAIPPTAWETRSGQGDVYRQMASIVEKKGVERLLRAMAEQPPTTMFGEDGKARAIRNLEAMDSTAVPYVFRGAAASDLPPHDALRAIRVPALVLAWNGDDGHPVSTAEHLATDLPDARLVVASSADEVAAWPDEAGRFLASL